MKDRKMRELRVIPRGQVPHANGESARPGEAKMAQNLREREDSLQVVGQPSILATIGSGERLLTMNDGHTVSCTGDGEVLIDGVVVAMVTTPVVGAHVIGAIMVIVARDGLVYLLPEGDSWTVLNPADAVPQLTFGVSTQVSQADINAVTFAEPYSQWRAPLADADRSTFAGLLRSAWNALENDAHAQGRHTAPMLVRWAVRLLDDTYLWVSDPVRVGDVTLANADRISALVNSGNSGFTGTQATTLPMTHYSLTIGMTSAIPAPWQALVKSIDVLATNEVQLLSASRELDYRCLTRTSGGREYVLEMGLARRSADAIAWELAASPWRQIATASSASQPGSATFATPVETVKLTAAQCAALAKPMILDGIVCSTAAGGRLYCCTAAGEIVVSSPGNALTEAHRSSVPGANPLAMAVVTRPLYSGGFGRYPVYVFTDDGIYAIPQRASDRLGEARLVDRTVIAADVPPVEAAGDIWLMSRHGHLCRLSGSRLSVACRDVDCRAMAWCNAHSELWLLPADGDPVVMMPSGAMSVRTVAATQLYSDARYALAVASQGTVLDLEREQPGMMDVAWHSHPIDLHPLMGLRVKRVVWHAVSDDAVLSLRVKGQCGIMAREQDVSYITVQGAVNQPLATPTMAIHARTLTLALDGNARTGTFLMPSLIFSL
jgi:hypothetical protein